MDCRHFMCIQHWIFQNGITEFGDFGRCSSVSSVSHESIGWDFVTDVDRGRYFCRRLLSPKRYMEIFNIADTLGIDRDHMRVFRIEIHR